MPSSLFLPQFELGDIQPGSCEKQYVGSKYDTIRSVRDKYVIVIGVNYMW
jgi:hypothetical protein